MKMRVSRAVGLIAFYGSLVVWLTWPLAARITTHLAAPHPLIHFDTLFSSWVLAWESHALMTDPASLFDANIYHPARRAIFYGPMGLGTLPYYLPTFVLTGNPALALNLAFLVSVALTACVVHVVVFWWTASRLGGFVAAWTLLMTRWILWDWAPIAPPYAVLFYFPLIVWMAAGAALRSARMRWLIPIIVLQGLTDAYIAAAVLVPLGLLGLWRLARTETRRAGLRLLGALALSAGVLLLSYSGQLAVRAQNPLLHEQTHWTAPAPATVLPWGPFRFAAPTGVPSVALLLIAAGMVGFLLHTRKHGNWQNRQAWTHGAFWGTTGLVMSMTPVALWQGEPITLPHAWLANWVPIYQALRVPSRLGVAGLMGLTILAGVAFAECEQRILRSGRRRALASFGALALAAFIAAAMYADYSRGLGRPATLRKPRQPMAAYPIALPPSYPLVHAIAPDSPIIRVLREPGGPLLELPIGRSGLSALPHAKAMYRSVFHWRRLLNGYSSYWPSNFPELMATALKLPEPGAVEALRRETGLEMILVRTQRMGAAKRRAWFALAQGGGRRGLRLVARHRGELLFSVVEDTRP